MLAGANARKAQATAQYALAVQGAFKNVHDALNVIASKEALVTTADKRIAALRAVLALPICATQTVTQAITKCSMRNAI